MSDRHLGGLGERANDQGRGARRADGRPALHAVERDVATVVILLLPKRPCLLALLLMIGWSVPTTAWADGAWSPERPVMRPRVDASATTLADGTVLICGGHDNDTEGGPALNADCELWDPGIRRARQGPTLVAPRAEHRAVRLRDGSVLVVGGVSRDRRLPVPLAERWRPGDTSFRPTRSQPRSAGTFVDVAELRDGRVLALSAHARWQFQPSAETWTALNVPTGETRDGVSLEDGTTVMFSTVPASSGRSAVIHRSTGSMDWTALKTVTDTHHHNTLVVGSEVLMVLGHDQAHVIRPGTDAIETFAVKGATREDARSLLLRLSDRRALLLRPSNTFSIDIVDQTSRPVPGPIAFSDGMASASWAGGQIILAGGREAPRFVQTWRSGETDAAAPCAGLEALLDGIDAGVPPPRFAEFDRLVPRTCVQAAPAGAAVLSRRLRDLAAPDAQTTAEPGEARRFAQRALCALAPPDMVPSMAGVLADVNAPLEARTTCLARLGELTTTEARAAVERDLQAQPKGYNLDPVLEAAAKQTRSLDERLAPVLVRAMHADLHGGRQLHGLLCAPKAPRLPRATCAGARTAEEQERRRTATVVLILAGITGALLTLLTFRLGSVAWPASVSAVVGGTALGLAFGAASDHGKVGNVPGMHGLVVAVTLFVGLCLGGCAGWFAAYIARRNPDMRQAIGIAGALALLIAALMFGDGCASG